ncbi:hypothetical protein ERJ75_001633400 [Trypanosoma vivax]|nr:hypothetical protein ERJ75_001633400 [Trypanosoma vivax]
MPAHATRLIRPRFSTRDAAPREQRPPSPAHMRIVSRALRQCVLDSAAPPAPPVHCTTGPCACWFLCRPVSDLFAERRPSPAQRRCLADRLRPDRAARRGERTTAKQLSVRCAPRQLAGMAPVRAGLARAAVEGAEGNWPAGLPWRPLSCRSARAEKVAAARRTEEGQTCREHLSLLAGRCASHVEERPRSQALRDREDVTRQWPAPRNRRAHARHAREEGA